MNTTFWRIHETIKGAASSVNSGRDFVKWVLSGCAAMIGLIIINADSALPLIGRTSLSLGISFLTFSIVSGFLAILAANATEGLLRGVAINEGIEGSEDWAKKNLETPFDQELFSREYGAIISGPTKVIAQWMAKDIKEGPSELIPAKLIGKAMSLFVSFTIIQMALSFLGILAMVAGMWCS